jgi:hypothetical protein
MTIVFVCSVAAPALGDDVPFAERTPTSASEPSDLRSSSLGELMDLTQSRHIKLWYAGQSQNWDLALYTLDRVAETLNKATMLYQNIPIKNVVQFDQPLVVLQDAIKQKSAVKFAQGYADLTLACSGCHKSAGVGFIAIKKPTSSPFSDQTFEPVAR